MTRSKDSIVDATTPSAGRIYDYLLGGHHNFEVDRQAAQMLLKMSPHLSRSSCACNAGASKMLLTS